MYFPHPTELYLSKYEIAFIESEAFKGLVSLRILDLSGNDLGWQVVDPRLAILQPLPLLEYLALDTNNIHYHFNYPGNSSNLKTLIKEQTSCI